MDNFDLKKYLAEGKLYEDYKAGHISSPQVVKIARETGGSVNEGEVEDMVAKIKKQFLTPVSLKHITPWLGERPPQAVIDALRDQGLLDVGI